MLEALTSSVRRKGLVILAYTVARGYMYRVCESFMFKKTRAHVSFPCEVGK